MVRKTAVGLAGAGLLALALSGCGGSSGNALVPAITPLVKAAAPAGFGGSASTTAVVELEKFYQKLQGGRTAAKPRFSGGFPGEIGSTPLDVTQIYSRFFGGSTGAGPTQIFQLLPQVDSRMAELTSSTNCLSGTAVKYNLVPAGVSSSSPIPMYAQCYRTVSGVGGSGPFTNSAGVTDPQFFMIGKDANGVYYLFEAIGAGWLAATETPQGGTNYSVHLWLGVGSGNGASGSNDGQCTQNGLGGVTGYDDCSYGVLEMIANTQIIAGVSSPPSNFEFTSAGTGLGYAGIQVISDGAYIYAVGSPDTGGTPAAVENLCLPATSTTTTGTYATPTLAAGTSINGCTVTPTCAAADATAGRCIPVNTTTGFALTPIGRITAPSAPNGALADSCYPGPASSVCTHAYYTSSGSFGANVTGMPTANNMQMLGTKTDSLYFAQGPPITGNSTFSGTTNPVTAAWAAAAGVTQF